MAQNKQETDIFRDPTNQSILFSLDKPSGQTSFYFHDALDSVVGITKSNGQSDKNYRYGDFGGIEPQNGNFTSPHNNFTYIGQEYDDNLNLTI